ncbi:hypothetical protein ACA910_005668 [Epithemia clementina (nom. ined.)]
MLAHGQRIAVIGQGITGSFVTKYLADYDVHCKMDSITIFEARPVEGPVVATTKTKGSNGDGAVVIDGPTTTSIVNDKDNNTTAMDDPTYWQGSRVTSVQLSENGMNIELGASIGHVNFHLVLEMIRNDPTLELGAPFSTGVDELDDDPRQQERSMGIYHGHDTPWRFRTWTSGRGPWTKWINKVLLLARYQFDLLKVTQLTQQAMDKFQQLPQLFHSTEADTFFASPAEIWQRLGLLPAVQTSWSAFLDHAGVTTEQEGGTATRNGSWWSWSWSWPFSSGLLRTELLTAINLVNYNQPNDQVNALVGLGSFAAVRGPLFSIRGGNHALIRSALRQARQVRHSSCLTMGRPGPVPMVVEQAVTHVIAHHDKHTGDYGLELFASAEGDRSLGMFDAVVLAAPLQQCRIQFLVQSSMDEAVLQPMPLGGLVDNHDDQMDEFPPPKDSKENPNDDTERQELETKSTKASRPLLQKNNNNNDDNDDDLLNIPKAWPRPLPDAARRPYTQVVTTVVRGGALRGKVLGLWEGDVAPRSILLTEAGKAALYNITAITRIHAAARKSPTTTTTQTQTPATSTSTSTYKLFSNDILNTTILQTLFGRSVQTEYVKVWGGAYGGATPQYQGTGELSLPFLLYDGAVGVPGHTTSGALYYPLAMELSTLACMEISATGAKAVAKLMAQRFGWIQATTSNPASHDEL